MSEKKQKERLEKSFKEVMEENKEKMDYINKNGKEIDNHLNNMKDVYLELLKKSCKGQFKWLEQHATVYSNENGVHVHVNSNPDGISADAVLSELDSCASKSDLGLKSFFSTSNSTKNIIVKQNEQCVNGCTFGVDSKSDDLIKSCINSCFMNTYNQTKSLLNEIKEKLDAAKNELKM